MSHSEAGNSSTAGALGAAKEVMLSVEPVHIYTDPNVPSTTGLGPSTSIMNAFERERKLQNITADGTNVFATRKPASVQLSEDVRRLWAERGDFSRFRTSDLLKKRTRDQSDGDTGSSDESDNDEPNSKEIGQGEDDGGLLRNADEARVGGTIAESEFVELRNKVLGNLDVAHFNSIHAHQLLGMLIKQHRSANTSTSTSGNAARLGSPAPSIGGQSARSASTAPARNAPLGIFSHLNTAANREEEFVLDPLAISLSRTSLNASTAARRTLDEEEGEDEEEDEFDADPTSAAYGLKQAKREMEGSQAYKENKLREFKVVLETKRKAIANAAELLSSAAEELRQSHAPNRERWRALIGLHGRGWGLTPGRPLLDVERFGVSSTEEEEDDGKPDTGNVTENDDGEKKADKKADKKEGKKGEANKAAGLQGFGTPIITSDGKVKEEGARDAWIGFGLPEAPIELRRRSIAYWADVSTSTSGSAEEVKQKLVFPDRMHRRLRVRFVLWPPTTTSSTEADEGGKRREWSSDSMPKPDREKKETVAVGQILDQELQDASREASDELVFGDVVAQARLLPPSFGVRLTSSSVRIVLTKRLDLVVELVPTSDNNTTCSGSSPAQQEELRYAPHAALLLAFLRLGPLRKHQAFVSATKLGRQSDAAARAAAIKAVALAVPKKSSAASAGKGKTDAAAGKGGIAAGGKATSAALGKLDTLGPVVVGLHYWSFVHRLGALLQGLQKNTQERGVTVKVQLVPIQRVSGTSRGLAKLSALTGMLGQMVDATPSRPYHSPIKEAKTEAEGAMHSLNPMGSSCVSKRGMDALRGYAKVFVQQRGSGAQSLVCTLSFGQPSLLSVQFASPKAAKDVKGIKLTNKPLSVDLDTLGTLLGQQIGQYL